MTAKMFTDLDAVTTPASTDVIPLQQGGITKRTTSAGLVNSVLPYLTAHRTYYVATTGSDSNTGLTAGSPFLTIQKALDTLVSIDGKGYRGIVQVADGTYNAGFFISGWLADSYEYISVVGNTGTPSNVIINATGNAVSCSWGGYLIVSGMKLQATSFGVQAYGSGADMDVSNVVFGACTSSHMFASTGGTIYVSGSYSVTGNAATHYASYDHGRILLDPFVNPVTVTLTGTPAFTTFADASNNSLIVREGTVAFSGSATGVRHSATTNSVINTQGSGATWFPGNSAGGTATGGQFV
jgi:hypothetical protein